MDQGKLKDLNALVRDLGRPRPLIYWADLAGCLILANVGMFLSGPFPDKVLAGSPVAVFGLVLAAFALFRASYFNHELAHHARELPGFEIAWNLTVGIPLLIPSYVYTDHLNHHSVKGFATDTDVEYLAPRFRGFRGAAALIALSVVLPFMYGARFLLITPVAWFSPAVRRWADTRASGLGLLGLSTRRPPAPSELFSWRIQELGCFAYLVVSLSLVATGVIPFGFALQCYTVIVILLVLHGIRIMVGHRYEVDGSNDRIEQVLDSFNFTGNRAVTALMAPIGFHLHALHHLYPKIPYHNMQEAHRRISRALPANSFYHAVEEPSYFRAVARFMIRGLSQPAPRPQPAELSSAAAARRTADLV